MLKQLLFCACLASSVFAFAQTTTPNGAATMNTAIGEQGNAKDFDMAPETNLQVVQAAANAVKSRLKPGKVSPTWQSLKDNYQVPAWYAGAKFGICMHWGLYSVPAYHNEWYEKHMYGTSSIAQWHVEHFGEQDKFGYKDFIPMFTAEKFDAEAWAKLIKASGARFFSPACQHHDGFALWDSQVTPFNSVNMGPKRDIIGELCRAVRKQGLKFGFTNHEIENFQFINPPRAMLDKMKTDKSDLFDPKWLDFYHVADRSDEACKKFLIDWFYRNKELIDKYQPDILWFDNGIDQRYLDPLKLMVASYYYNSAQQWGKAVTLNTKKAAFAPSGTNIETIGAVLDFENKGPAAIRTGVWDVDTKIGSTWGYTEGMRVYSPASLIGQLADIVSKNGTMMLNISPKADGTIPQEQQNTLLGIGKWLGTNGEAIYDTHNWIKANEGINVGSPKVYFTVKGQTLYAIIVGKWSGGNFTIKSVTDALGKVSKISLLGSKSGINFSQSADGLQITLPDAAPCDYAYTLKIEGLKMNDNTATPSGNPIPNYPYQ